MIIVISLVIVFSAIGCGCMLSKSRFEKKMSNVHVSDDRTSDKHKEVKKELDRIDELKRNLKKIDTNIKNLQIPVPEALASYDSTQSSLDKISKFYEKYNLQISGVDQFIMSILPVSQIGASLESMVSVLPPDISHKVFGDALSSIKDGLHPDSFGEFLHRFGDGMGHLSHHAINSAAHAMEHGNYLSAITTPLKAGLMEACGVNDAMHNVVGNLHEIGSSVASSAEHCTSVADLSSSTDLDLTGHIPVITLAFSSFREFKLLSADKTNFISSTKNIALDAAGTGLGGAAGAKAGALMGAALGPAGAVVGGLIGGIGGAIFGRSLSNKVKMRPLNNAIEEYETNYHAMQRETEEQTKKTLGNIRNYSIQQREQFKGNNLLKSQPVEDISVKSCATSIAAVLLQFVQNEIAEMKHGVEELKKSFWYSSKKYDSVVGLYEQQIVELERQIPSADKIKHSPEVALQCLMTLKMPNRQANAEYQEKMEQCRKDLKTVNDKNDSSILMWSYMVNNLYQNTLNQIADFSNKQMAALNTIFEGWKTKMSSLEQKVKKEKEKLGLE